VDVGVTQWVWMGAGRGKGVSHSRCRCVRADMCVSHKLPWRTGD
jgi:hypothetical protein